MKLSVDVNYTGKILTKGFESVIGDALVNTVKRVAKVSEEAAKKDYASKRKTKTPPLSQSRIISSFHYTAHRAGLLSAVAIVFAGGPKAPHAIYVDQPRKGFAGYKFMEAGMREGAERAPEIVKEEFDKAFKR